MPLGATVEAQATAPALRESQIGEGPSRAEMVEGATEWIVAAGLGWGAAVFRSSGEERLLLLSASWGRVLTDARGPSRVRGRFSWAVTVIPLFLQLEPERAFGIGVSPLVWRWNFEAQGRVVPYAEVGGGGLWTNTDVPRATARANYVMHVTVAARLRVRGNRMAIVGYSFEHVSNGNRAPRNPGVNAHVLELGWSFIQPPK